MSDELHSPMQYLPAVQLKQLADSLVRKLGRVPPDGRQAILDRIESVRDEMARRLLPPADGSGPAGVREPRRPRPGGDAAAVVQPISD